MEVDIASIVGNSDSDFSSEIFDSDVKWFSVINVSNFVLSESVTFDSGATDVVSDLVTVGCNLVVVVVVVVVVASEIVDSNSSSNNLATVVSRYRLLFLKSNNYNYYYYFFEIYY